MSIPKALIDNIREGNVVLFLGAGASIGAIHNAGKSTVDGKHLAEMLIDKYLGPEYKGTSLIKAAELSIDQTDPYSVQDYIASIFKEYMPADFHLIIPTFIWKSIYTTNYDLIIERAYEVEKTLDRESCLQTVVPILRNTDKLDEKLKQEDSIPFSKLHGCVTLTNDNKYPLILTTEQYITHRKDRSFLFERFVQDAAQHPVIYIGSNLDDSDIRAAILDVKKQVEVTPRSYIVLPGLKPAEKSYWENQGFTCLDMRFEQFLREINSTIDKTTRKLAKIIEKYDHPISKRFVVNVEMSDKIKLLLTKYFEYVDKNIKPLGLSPQQFYKGFCHDFTPVIQGYDFKRSISDSIVSEILLVDESEKSSQELYLIKGYAGSGKTILLRRIAWDGGIIWDKLCLWLNSSVLPDYDSILELYRLCKQRIFLFIDPANKHQDAIKHWLDQARIDKVLLTIIVGERNHEWNSSCSDLFPYVTETYELKYLRDNEIDELLFKLKENKSLGYLASLPLDKQKLEFTQMAGRQLLVALYEATLGKPFEEIVFNEYQSITSIRAKSLYITTCILHRLGLPARAGLISRVHGISFIEFREKLFKPLELIVDAYEDKLGRDYIYVSRHPVVAEMVFSQVLQDEQDRHNEYMRLISGLDMGYSSDRQAFNRLVNARDLMLLFKSSENIRKLYKDAKDRIGEDPFLLQQEAIFEMNSEDGSLEKAGDLLRKADSKQPGNKYIRHSLSEWALKKSEHAETIFERNKYRQESGAISRQLAKEEIATAHPYHTLIKIGIEELLETFESEDKLAMERKTDQVEKLIESAKQAFPDDSMILAEESKFFEYINNHPKALNALEQAFFNNKGNPYIAVRLARLYENENRSEDAIRVLTECVDTKPGDRYANFNLATLLMKYNPEKKADIKIFLRRAFTDGDKNYLAQFWFARTLYIEDPRGDAKKYFSALNDIRMDPNEKNEVRGIVMENRISVKFTGSILKKELSLGFISRDGYRDQIFAHQNDTEEHVWEELREGNRVTFELGFSYRGPKAISITKETLFDLGIQNKI